MIVSSASRLAASSGPLFEFRVSSRVLGGVRPELAVLVNGFRGCFDGDELVERVHLDSMCPTGYFIEFSV